MENDALVISEELSTHAELLLILIFLRMTLKPSFRDNLRYARHFLNGIKSESNSWNLRCGT
jgi:hypothetical protein